LYNIILVLEITIGQNYTVADNFHHATIVQEGDPSLDSVLKEYEQTGIKWIQAI